MIFCGSSVVLLAVIIIHSIGFMDTIKQDTVPFKIGNSNDDERGIYARTKIEERRNFFHLFNVPYIICFFAAKGKWPFIPSFMQVQVDQVGRSIFTQSDGFIKNYCHKWIQIKECFRPHHIVPVHPQPYYPTDPPSEPEVETFPPEPLTTPCSCAQRVIEGSKQSSLVIFDKSYIGNVSTETILNTIEFLQSFLPPPTPPTKKPVKKKTKVRDRL